MDQRFSAAVFDLDGTVADSSLLHLETFNTVLKPLGITIQKEFWLEHYEGTGSKHIIEDVLLQKGMLGKVDVETLRQQRLVKYKELAQRKLIAVRGFSAFFDQLKSLKVPSIIATNAEPENVTLALEILKLTEEPTVTGKEAGRMKPDPAVYTLACKKLGKKPADCVVFEDSVSGVLAAKRAGCYCVCVLTTNPEERLKEAGADLVVKDFTKLTPSMFF